MFNNFRKDPAKILTVVLLVALVLSCALMISSRGIYDSCSGCGGFSCGSCEGIASHNVIDTSGYTDVHTKNNLDLVRWAEDACDNGWGYVYGTWGNVLDQSLLTTKAAQYMTDVGQNMELIREQWMGRRVTDCVGLIKGYCWYSPRSGKFEYCSNGMPDMGANRMLESAEESGTIDTIPEIPGIAVCAKGHIGVYVGDGWVVEAKSTADGVIRTRLEERPWTHWCKIPHIEYYDHVEHYVLEDSQ